MTPWSALRDATRPSRHAVRPGPWLLVVSTATRVSMADPQAAETPYEVVVHEPVGPRASSRDETAASTVLKGEALSVPGGSVAQALSRVPGVQMTRSGASSDHASASIRAATAAQTPVLLAGIRLNEEVTGSVDLSSIPLWMLDRIEIYRGDAPAHSDQLGLGGAIVLEPELPGEPHARVGAGVGSYGERNAWVGVSTGTDQSSALIGLRAAGAINDYPYVDDRGTRFNSREDRLVKRANADSTSYDLWALGRHRAGTARITTVLNVLEREQGVSGLLVVPALHARASTRRWLGALGARVPCSAGRTACSVELSTSALAARNGLSDPFRELGLGTTDAHNDSARLIQRIALAFAPFDGGELTLAGQESLDSLDIWRLGFGRSVSHRTGTSGTLSLAYHPAETWTLYGLGRGDCQSTWQDDAAGPCSLLLPSGRVGAKWAALERVTLLANLGRYVRVPTLGELFGVSTAILGNPELEAEAGTSADVGARVDTAPKHRRALAAHANAWAFARQASNLVAYRRSSVGILRPFNVNAARILGLEVSTGARWLDTLETELGVTALDPRDVSAARTVQNDLLPLTSQLVFVDSLQAYQEFDSRVIGYASFGLTLTHRSSRYADPAGTVTIPHAWSTDLAAVTRWSRNRLTVRAAIENILDARAFDLVGLPLPGRTWHGSMEAQW